MPRDISQAAQLPVSKNLYLSNLSPTVSEAVLLALVKPYGQVTELSLIYTAHPRIAFVSFSTVDQAKKAIQALNRTMLHSYTLNIGPAKPKTQSVYSAGKGKGKKPSPTMSTEAQILKIQAKLNSIKAQKQTLGQSESAELPNNPSLMGGCTFSTATASIPSPSSVDNIKSDGSLFQKLAPVAPASIATKSELNDTSSSSHGMSNSADTDGRIAELSTRHPS